MVLSVNTSQRIFTDKSYFLHFRQIFIEFLGHMGVFFLTICRKFVFCNKIYPFVPNIIYKMLIVISGVL